jgi:fatty-acid peroxygenase
MTEIPKEKGLDKTITLMKEGYEFLPKRRERFKSEIFQTRIMLKKATCLSGKEGAALFFDPDKFIRKNVIPGRVKKTLLGKGGLHGLDDQAHKHRKDMFMSMMTQDKIEDLLDYFTIYWREYLMGWEKQDKAILFDQSREVICKAACAWTGVPVEDDEVKQKAQDFSTMVDAFGAVGPRHWRGRMARSRTESWIAKIINAIRQGKLHVPEDSPAHRVAMFKDLDGNHLDIKTASVELINFIRPTVAIAYYVAFAALALHQHPELRDKLKNGTDAEALRFVQEVRRYFPFAPFLGAYARKDFEWKGHHFHEGEFTLIDIYGTNRDPFIWKNPDEFDPDRFIDWKGNAFDFIPQGGGNHYTGHRCPGEWITIEMTKLAVKFLTKHMEYDVPAQDLSFSLSRMPTMPKSRFVMTNVKAVNMSNFYKTEQGHVKSKSDVNLGDK